VHLHVRIIYLRPTFSVPEGQKAVADIDPIIEEVHRTQQMFEDIPLAKMGTIEGKAVLGAATKAYEHGISTPYTSLIANLSFASLRSGANTMKGTGSRALPVLEKALEHTPKIMGEHIWDVSDPGQIRDQLNQMLTRLGEGRDSVLRNESKGGVIRSVEAPSGGGSVAARLLSKTGPF